MAEAEKSVDTRIAEALAARTSFLLDAGAGAGKTYSLVLGIKTLLEAKRTELQKSGQQIACITFTNVAKDQIATRLNFDPLVRVSTIHDFLWELIQPHQRALRPAVVRYNAELKDSSRRKVSEDLVPILSDATIIYSDTGTNLRKGRLYHDDLLGVARIMFADNPMLARLCASRYPYLFIDEYQDTTRQVIDIIFVSLLPRVKEGFTVGFFGDKMQNIFNGSGNPGIGELPPEYVGQLVTTVKPDNRRCPLAVINVLNKIRDDIQQIPAHDNIAGEAVFLIAPGDDGLDRALDFLRGKGWSLDPSETKLLFLTHRLIAKKAGYGDLVGVYRERGGFFAEDLLGGDDQTIAFFIEKVEALANAWKQGKQGEAITILRKGGLELASVGAKKTLREAIDKLAVLRTDGSVRDVLAHIRETRLFPLLDELSLRLDSPDRDTSKMDEKERDREKTDAVFYRGLLSLPYTQVSAFVEFFLDHTPFATKHGVKGAEYQDVLVILDDAGANWTMYSFDKYLSGAELPTVPRWKRTRNLFYVACSRARRRLAVIDLGQRDPAKESRVADLFGADKVVALPALERN
ncbi:MAG: ATP-dependent helicase UvrD/PcrA [Acidobacteriota bacterium]|nr:ATP-dependent helicase UvrD/PcrA [Acidobacteriota bacterium]